MVKKAKQEKNKRVVINFKESDYEKIKKRAKLFHSPITVYIRAATNLSLRSEYPKVILENSDNYVQLLKAFNGANELFKQCYGYLNIITPDDDESSLYQEIKDVKDKLVQIQLQYLNNVDPLFRDLWLKSSSGIINQPNYVPESIKKKKIGKEKL